MTSMIAAKFPPAILVQMIQRNIPHQMVELVYYSHQRWPLPRTGSIPPGRVNLRIMVLDSSFNPPTKAHLALANHPRPPTPNNSDGSNGDYDAKLLLLSLLNADKPAKPGDATYAQRLEMMSLLAKDVINRNSNGEGAEFGNVAVAIIQQPIFVKKSTVLRSFLKQRLAELNEKTPKNTPDGTSLLDINLTFMLGFDTLERVFAPRYYDSEEDMFSALGNCLGKPPTGEGSRIVCAHRDSSQDARTEAAKKTLDLAHDFIASGQIAFIDIGKEECTYSSTRVRSIIGKAGSLDEVKEWKSWQSFVTDKVAAYIIKQELYCDRKAKDLYLPNMGDE